VESDLDRYIGDYIHFTKAGAELAANSIVGQLNRCPEGRWYSGLNTLKPDAQYPPNPHDEYPVQPGCCNVDEEGAGA
jgi:hypothetical protein